MSRRTEPTHPAADAGRRPPLRRPIAGAVAGGLAVTTLVAGGYLLFDRREQQSGPLQTAPVSRADVDQTVDLTGAVKRLSAVLVTPPAPGVVDDVRVKVGDHVEAGQVLATMNTKAAREALTKAQAKVVQARAGAVTRPPSVPADGSRELKSAQRAANSARNAVNAAAGARERARTACSSLATTAGIDPSPARPARVPSPPAPAVPTSRPARPSPAAAAGSASGSTPRSTPEKSSVPSEKAPASSAPAPDRKPTSSASSAAPEPVAPQASSTPRADGSAPDRSDRSDRSDPAGTSSSAGLRVDMEQLSLTRPLTAGTSLGPATGPRATARVVPGTAGVKAEPSERQVQACVDALAAAMASDRNASGVLNGLSTELERASAQMQRMSATADSAALAARAGSNASMAALVKAEAELAMAQQAVDGGTLVAGIAGEVTSVDLAKGEAVLPGNGIGIAGKGAAELIVNVPLVRVGLLRVGQAAAVQPPGGGKILQGRITAIESAPSEDGSLAPLYPVHVTVSDAPTSLGTGAIATASIKVASVDGVKTVPVSALPGFTAGKGTVQVIVDGMSTERAVEVGAVGQGRVEIRSGLKYGETVVLADPGAELPNDMMDGLTLPRPSNTD